MIVELFITIPVTINKNTIDVTFTADAESLKYNHRTHSRYLEVHNITFSDLNLEDHEIVFVEKYLEKNYSDIEQQLINDFYEGE